MLPGPAPPVTMFPVRSLPGCLWFTPDWLAPDHLTVYWRVAVVLRDYYHESASRSLHLPPAELPPVSAIIAGSRYFYRLWGRHHPTKRGRNG